MRNYHSIFWQTGPQTRLLVFAVHLPLAELLFQSLDLLFLCHEEVVTDICPTTGEQTRNLLSLVLSVRDGNREPVVRVLDPPARSRSWMFSSVRLDGCPGRSVGTSRRDFPAIDVIPEGRPRRPGESDNR